MQSLVLHDPVAYASQTSLIPALYNLSSNTMLESNDILIIEGPPSDIVRARLFGNDLDDVSQDDGIFQPCFLPYR
jgi:hypothetical protein